MVNFKLKIGQIQIVKFKIRIIFLKLEKTKSNKYDRASYKPDMAKLQPLNILVIRKLMLKLSKIVDFLSQ